MNLRTLIGKPGKPAFTNEALGLVKAVETQAVMRTFAHRRTFGAHF
jgi:hypothetical protein